MKRHLLSKDFLFSARAARPRSIVLMSALPVVAAAIAVAIFIIDAFVAVDIAIAVLYVAVVLMSVTFFGRRGVIAVSAVCMALTILAFLIQHSPDPESVSVARCVLSLLTISI